MEDHCRKTKKKKWPTCGTTLTSKNKVMNMKDKI